MVMMCSAGLQLRAQIIPSPIVIDSTLANPKAKLDSAFLPKKDTTVSIKAPTETNPIKTANKVKPGVPKDSARLAIEKMPRRAAIRSATIPGWGQIKNGHWWKVPIAYGGLVGAGLVIEFNQRYYAQVLNELQFRFNNEDQKRDQELIKIDQQGLIQYKTFYRRARDYGILMGVGVYAITIIDAYVSAKFFRFDISDELGIKIKPTLMPSFSHAYAPVPALKIQLSL